MAGFILAVGYKWCNIQVTNLDSPVHISSKKPWEQTALAYKSVVCIHVCAVVFIHLYTCGEHRLMLGFSFVTLHLVFRDRVSHWAWSSSIWLAGVTSDPGGWAVSTSRHWRHSRQAHPALLLEVGAQALGFFSELFTLEPSPSAQGILCIRF